MRATASKTYITDQTDLSTFSCFGAAASSNSSWRIRESRLQKESFDNDAINAYEPICTCVPLHVLLLRTSLQLHLQLMTRTLQAEDRT